MADPFHIGIIEALFKVIEERVPFGKQITTVASVLVMFGIIVFVSQFLIITLLLPIGGAMPYVASFFRSLSGFHFPLPPKLPPEIHQAILVPFTIVFVMDMLLLLVVYLDRTIQKDQEDETHRRLNILEKVVGVEPEGTLPQK
jgi:hypothetical protein